MWFVIGGLLLFMVAMPMLLVVGIRHLGSRAETTSLRAILETPTLPVTQLSPGRRCELQGRCAAAAEPPLVSPFTGRQVLGYYIDIREQKPTGHGLHWRKVHELRERRGFWLEDGSGARAWVIPNGATAFFPLFRYGGTSVLDGPIETVFAMTPAVDAWARTQVPSTRNELSVEVREFAAGDQMYVLGWPTPYHGTMCMQEAPGKPLLLSTFREDELVERLTTRARGRGWFSVVTYIALALSLALLGLGTMRVL